MERDKKEKEVEQIAEDNRRKDKVIEELKSQDQEFEDFNIQNKGYN
jgi:hypothetical protein